MDNQKKDRGSDEMHKDSQDRATTATEEKKTDEM